MRIRTVGFLLRSCGTTNELRTVFSMLDKMGQRVIGWYLINGSMCKLRIKPVSSITAFPELSRTTHSSLMQLLLKMAGGKFESP